MTSDAILDFLLRAKRSTYASQGDDASVTPLLAGSRQLEHREGSLLYRDIYVGFRFFIGQEIVTRNDTPLWSMVYHGGVPTVDGTVTVGQVYGFLQAALRHVPADLPYRGPAQFDDGDMRYINSVDGNFEQFAGIETILHRGVEVYRLSYGGGSVR